DLVVRRPDEVRELDLRDGDEAVHGHPHGRADDTALAQGRIDHARVAELVEQTRGHAEHAADLPDVFTQQDYALVPTHRNPQRVVDRLDHVHLGHGFRGGSLRGNLRLSETWGHVGPG